MLRNVLDNAFDIGPSPCSVPNSHRPGFFQKRGHFLVGRIVLSTGFKIGKPPLDLLGLLGLGIGQPK